MWIKNILGVLSMTKKDRLYTIIEEYEGVIEAKNNMIKNLESKIDMLIDDTNTALEYIDKLESKENNSELSDMQKTIAEHYGFDHQLDKLQEELAELTLSIYRFTSDEWIPNKILLIQELADVKNLIEQLEILDPYIEEGIQCQIKYKCERQLDRIERIRRQNERDHEELFG